MGRVAYDTFCLSVSSQTQQAWPAAARPTAKGVRQRNDRLPGERKVRRCHTRRCSLAHRLSFVPATFAQVPVYGHLVCNGCSIMLMYPVGAQSVKCSVCHYVTPVTAATAAAGGASGSVPAARPKTKQTVVVENPPSYDEKGNEVRWGGLRRLPSYLAVRAQPS